MDFAGDSTAGLSPEVLEAIVTEAAGSGPPYGEDAASKALDHRFSVLFETEARAFPVSSGTAANCLALACLVPPHGRIICAERSHLVTYEEAAPETFTGCRFTAVNATDGLMSAAAFEDALGYPERAPHTIPAAAVSLSQAAETGRCYPLTLIREIAEVAHRQGLKVHLDGARFANALAHLDATPAEVAWRLGVDAVSFGATKNGALAVDAVVFFDLAAAERFERLSKRHGHLLCKLRFLSAQLHAYLADDRWLVHARHANAMAQSLARGLEAIEGVRLAFPVETNILFVRMPFALNAALNDAGARYNVLSVGGPEVEARLATNFQTTPQQVERFLDIAAAAAGTEARLS